MEAYVRWVRPNEEPGEAVETDVFAAVEAAAASLADATLDGSDAGTSFFDMERDVSFWFQTPSLEALTAVVEAVRVASGGVGSVEAVKPLTDAEYVAMYGTE